MTDLETLKEVIYLTCEKQVCRKMIKESAGTCQRIFYATSLTRSRSILSDIEVYKIQSLPSSS